MGEATVAGRIVRGEGLITTNLKPFRQKAIVGLPVEVARSTSDGTSIYPGGIAPVLPNAESAQMHSDGKGGAFSRAPARSGKSKGWSSRLRSSPLLPIATGPQTLTGPTR